jgi:hypothetical protein
MITTRFVSAEQSDGISDIKTAVIRRRKTRGAFALIEDGRVWSRALKIISTAVQSR